MPHLSTAAPLCARGDKRGCSSLRASDTEPRPRCQGRRYTLTLGEHPGASARGDSLPRKPDILAHGRARPDRPDRKRPPGRAVLTCAPLSCTTRSRKIPLPISHHGTCPLAPLIIPRFRAISSTAKRSLQEASGTSHARNQSVAEMWNR
jgi:hypothetical protein